MSSNYYTIDELLVLLDLIDYVLEDLQRKFNFYGSLNDCVTFRLRIIREKVKANILLIEPDYELPY